MSEAYPQGFRTDDLVHEDPLLLAGVAAFARLKYLTRAAQITGQFNGGGRAIRQEWVVLMGGRRYPLELAPIAGGYLVSCDGDRRELVSDWKLGQILFEGACNGERFCMQIERRNLTYRVMHRGAQADAMVMTARDAHLLSLMPRKPPADLSKFLLSPMPGLLTELAVAAGQEIKAGEKLAVIEAMKMENILRAERDCVVAEVLATQGDSVAVDQPILRFA